MNREAPDVNIHCWPQDQHVEYHLGLFGAAESSDAEFEATKMTRVVSVKTRNGKLYSSVSSTS